MNILITGSSGFIGFHQSLNLILLGYNIIGVDDLNNYYDLKLKIDRTKILKKHKNFKFCRGSISDNKFLKKLFIKHNIKYVINLAAYAGVRHSFLKPQDYIDSNITGFLNILELSKEYKIKHLLYASSSSVYGKNKKFPSMENDNTDRPTSLYGATKKANELMAHTYSNIFNLPTSGLRFFTVYGPWGRPDMALFLFVDAIINNKPIKVFNNGNHYRDFTYIDDITNSISKLLFKPSKRNKKNKQIPFEVYNIGNNDTIKLTKFINIIERKLGKKSIKKFYDMQMGDVEKSYASTDKIFNKTGFKPFTKAEVGIGNFIDWYIKYYKVQLN